MKGFLLEWTSKNLFSCKIKEKNCDIVVENMDDKVNC